MKNKILCLVLVLSLVLIVGCDQEETTKTPEALENPTTESLSESDYVIVIENNLFKPTTLEVNVGDSIEWINKDNYTYVVTLENAEFDEKLPSGANAIFTTTQPGELIYHCTIHPQMQGNIIVS